MSMSTYVIGFIPPDETWQKMKAVWDACKAADLNVPPEVERFSEGQVPDDTGQKVQLPIRRWNSSEYNSEGYELDVAQIPASVKTIRFYNSW